MQYKYDNDKKRLTCYKLYRKLIVSSMIQNVSTNDVLKQLVALFPFLS